MNHYLYSKYVCVPVLTILILSCKEQTEVAKKPNIIYILADDLGYAELGCYGQGKIETPNIDKLAKRGMRFMQNYSGSPGFCSVSLCYVYRITFRPCLYKR